MEGRRTEGRSRRERRSIGKKGGVKEVGWKVARWKIRGRNGRTYCTREEEGRKEGRGK